jgi:hypothetical protein
MWCDPRWPQHLDKPRGGDYSLSSGRHLGVGTGH